MDTPEDLSMADDPRAPPVPDLGFGVYRIGSTWVSATDRSRQTLFELSKLHPDLCRQWEPPALESKYRLYVAKSYTLRPPGCKAGHEYHVAPSIVFTPLCSDCERYFHRQAQRDTSTWVEVHPPAGVEVISRRAAKEAADKAAKDAEKKGTKSTPSAPPAPEGEAASPSPAASGDSDEGPPDAPTAGDEAGGSSRRASKRR